MSNRDLYLAGRVFGIVIAIAMIFDVAIDHDASYAGRIIALSSIFLTLLVVGSRQVLISYKYEGIPILPLAFRWVIAFFLWSMALLVLATVIMEAFPEALEDWLVMAVWLQAAEMSIYFLVRWIVDGRPMIDYREGTGKRRAR